LSLPCLFLTGLLFRNEPSLRNLPEAFRYYRMAIDKGDSNALVNLANCYKDEPSVKNIMEALRHYKLAVEKNHLTAIYNLAVCYRNEVEIKDVKEAVKYYKMAADKGHLDAMNNLGDFLFFIFLLFHWSFSYSSIFCLFLVCSRSLFSFSFSLITFRFPGYCRLIGYVLYCTSPIFFFSGFRLSDSFIGLCYRSEPSVRNLEEAIRYYRMAIDKGDTNALVNLSNCYKDEPTMKNVEEAIRLYKQGEII
jgi:TPR repeat protein